MTKQASLTVPQNLVESGQLELFLQRLIVHLDTSLGIRGEGESLNEQVKTLAEAIIVLSEEQENYSTSEQISKVIEETFAHTWIKAFVVTFNGRSTNGPVTTLQTYNIASGERTAIGEYVFTVTQNSMFGTDLDGNTSGAISYTLAPNVNTDAFIVYLETDGLPANTFKVLVYEAIQGAGNKLTLVPYDPVGVDDFVDISGLLNIPGVLPPA